MASRAAILPLLALLAGCALPASGIRATQPDVTGTMSPAAACASPARGLMVWIDSLDETRANPAILRYLPSDARLCGASIVVLWSAIDRGPSAAPQYSFATLERAIAPWAAAHKRVNLLLAGVNETGSVDTATPAWVLAQTGANHVDVVPCPNPGGKQNAGPPTPVYWEPGYRRPWTAFIRAVMRRYGNDPRIGYMRFGLGAGAEDFPQHGADGNCFAAWAAYGMSARRWARFSAGLAGQIAAIARATHATAQQMVALNAFEDPAHPYDVAGAVAAAAANDGVGFGTENLGAGNYGGTAVPCTANDPVPYWCAAFQTYAGTVPLEFQPISWTLNPAFPKLAPLPKLLPYALLNHAQIFELYPQEWLTADDPQFSTYAAHHAAWSSALTKAATMLARPVSRARAANGGIRPHFR